MPAACAAGISGVRIALWRDANATAGVTHPTREGRAGPLFRAAGAALAGAPTFGFPSGRSASRPIRPLG